MNAKQFIKELKSYTGSNVSNPNVSNPGVSNSNVFNPYTDKCDVYDRHDASRIRTANLSNVLNAAIETGVDSIWIGRDLGHRGGRRTGLALTDEAHLKDASEKWGVPLNQATKGDLFAERTAVNIWTFMNALEQNIFMWNVFPFHPHEKGKPLTNRSHTAKERDYGIFVLEALEALLQPKRLVAIGNDAYQVSERIFANKEVHKIRHPSYGGEKIFAKQIKDLYKIRRKK